MSTDRKYPRVVLLKAPTWPGSRYKKGGYYYLVGETTRGGMMLQDEDRPSREGERSVILAKTPRGGASWFLGSNVRPVRARGTSTRDASRAMQRDRKKPRIMNWVRGYGPGSQKDVVEVYVYGPTRRSDEGQVGHDMRVRPTRLGPGSYTMVVAPDTLEPKSGRDRARRRDFTSKYTGKKRRLGKASHPHAIDAALSDREMRLRKAAYAASHGELRGSVDSPHEPNPVEEHYLRAIEAFKSRRPTLGYDLLERGDHRALLRYGRERRAKARGGRFRQQ